MAGDIQTKEVAAGEEGEEQERPGLIPAEEVEEALAVAGLLTNRGWTDAFQGNRPMEVKVEVALGVTGEKKEHQRLTKHLVEVEAEVEALIY